jgi:hypothetical protein
LALEFALQCATDVAVALRNLHAQGLTHGRVCAESVFLRDTTARLALGPSELVVSRNADVCGFGTVLFQLVHGFEPPVEQPEQDGDSLVSAATELAYRCIEASPRDGPDVRRVLVELRLLALMARQRKVSPETPVAASRPRPSALEAPLVAPDFNLGTVQELLPGEERCPRCQSAYVYESKPRTWFEGLLSRFHVSLHRCHRCYHRYWKAMGISIGKESPLV